MTVPGLLFFIAGILALVSGVDGRFPWVLIAIAGAMMTFR